MRSTGSKNKIARREGMDLGLKTPGSKSHATLLKKLLVRPGQHGLKMRRKTSEHSKQLREKQKLRFMFGVSERQMKNYFKKAVSRPGNTGSFFSEYLEERLDNVIYRGGFAPTRAASRQLVSHKHVKVNDKIVNSASMTVRVGDVLTLSSDKIQKIPAIAAALSIKDGFIPAWIDRKGAVIKMVARPTAEIIEKQINLRLVVEFYSR